MQVSYPGFLHKEYWSLVCFSCDFFGFGVKAILVEFIGFVPLFYFLEEFVKPVILNASFSIYFTPDLLASPQGLCR